MSSPYAKHLTISFSLATKNNCKPESPHLRLHPPQQQSGFLLVTLTFNFDQNSVKVNQQTYRSKVICALTLLVGRQEGHPACKI